MNLLIIGREDFFRLKKDILSEISTILDEKISNSSHKEWLTEKEACELLDVSKSTIQNYRSSGVLSFSQYGNKIKYRYDDLMDFLTDNYIDNGI